MIQIPAKQAVSELDELLKKVTHGHEVVIIGTDGSAYKLLALPRLPSPYLAARADWWKLLQILMHQLMVLKSTLLERL
jgi:antitoxin (DNA-binding transcriptional repressor) of toxin-antitoxin stability system